MKAVKELVNPAAKYTTAANSSAISGVTTSSCASTVATNAEGGNIRSRRCLRYTLWQATGKRGAAA